MTIRTAGKYNTEKLKQPELSFAETIVIPYQNEIYGLEQKRHTVTRSAILTKKLRDMMTMMTDDTSSLENGKIIGHKVTNKTKKSGNICIGIGKENIQNLLHNLLFLR